MTVFSANGDTTCACASASIPRAFGVGSNRRSCRFSELNALILFKTDMGAFIRLYTFLSQIFDYGNTAIEKRAIFC
jgi:hypothetical protein